MKVTFLGTGTSQGIPVIGCDCNVCHSLDFRDKRLRTSIHIDWDGTSMVVDTGPDFRMQMLRSRVKKLDAVLYTHEHKDHVAGMDEVRSFNFLQDKAMPVYGCARVIERLKEEFSYVFQKEKYPGVPSVDVHEITNAPFEVEGKQVTPIDALHHKLPVFGFRFGDFSYLTDANYLEEAEKDKMRGSRVIVLNALQQEPHLSHFTLDEAVSLMRELNPDHGYLVHMGHRMGRQRDVEHKLPDFIDFAHDGLEIEI